MIFIFSKTYHHKSQFDDHSKMHFHRSCSDILKTVYRKSPFQYSCSNIYRSGAITHVLTFIYSTYSQTSDFIWQFFPVVISVKVYRPILKFLLQLTGPACANDRFTSVLPSATQFTPQYIICLCVGDAEMFKMTGVRAVDWYAIT